MREPIANIVLPEDVLKNLTKADKLLRVEFYSPHITEFSNQWNDCVIGRIDLCHCVKHVIYFF